MKKLLIGILSTLTIISGLLIGLVLEKNTPDVLGGYKTKDETLVLRQTSQTYEFFASSTPGAVPTKVASTTNATSTNVAAFTDDQGRIDNGYFVVSGAKKVELFFQRGGSTAAHTGTSSFWVQVSPNGTDWYDFNRLRQATSTTEQTYATLSSWDYIGAGTNATNTLRFGLNLDYITPFAIRCIHVVVKDGDGRCYAKADW